MEKGAVNGQYTALLSCSKGLSLSIEAMVEKSLMDLSLLEFIKPSLAVVVDTNNVFIPSVAEVVVETSDYSRQRVDAEE